MMQTELIQLFQQKWRFYIRSMKKRRKALLFDTSSGPFFVKGYDSLTKAQWVVSLSEQLSKKGFTNTLEYLYGMDGMPYIPYNGKYYVAMKPIAGRDAQYDNPLDVFRTVSCLGEFHRHARNIFNGPVIQTESAPLIDKWQDRFDRFRGIMQKMKRSRSLGGFETKILRFSPYVMEEAVFAMDLAARSPFQFEYVRALAERQIAHRDLASHNFLIGSRTYLIDYDTSSYDTQLVDLIQMINRTMDQQSWNFALFAKMIEIYERSISLTDQQRDLVYLLLRYPDNFMREVIGLYEGSSGFVSKKVEAYLLTIMKQWQERKLFFQGSRHFFYEGPHSDSSNVVS